jgi:hypothetical protein
VILLLARLEMMTTDPPYTPGDFREFDLDGTIEIVIRQARLTRMPPEVVATLEKVSDQLEKLRKRQGFFSTTSWREMAKTTGDVRNSMLRDVDSAALLLGRPRMEKAVPPEEEAIAKALRERRVVFVQDETKSPSPITQVFFVNSDALPDPAAILPQIAQLKSLETLFVPGQPVTDDDLAALKGAESLQYLSLSRTKATDAGMRALKSLKNLKQVWIYKLPLTDKGLESLAELPALKRIFGAGAQISDDMIAKLHKEKKIRVER